MEEWKEIAGYEGLYVISNLGHIKSLKTGNLKKFTVAKNGYCVTTLYKNNQGKTCYIHRLIAIAFIPNPNNLKVINHKDGNKLNNCLINLEWCSYSQNNKHAFSSGLKTVSEANKKKFGEYASFRCKTSPPRRKKVVKEDLQGNVIEIYDSIKQAALINNCNIEAITNAIRGKSRIFKNVILRECI